MSKYRSKTDYAQIMSGDKQGYNLGLDGAMFLKREAVQRTFQPPSIGTQGKSTSAASPSTDISASSNANLKIAVDGGPVISVGLTVTGKTTGSLIAAELETKINAALAAASLDTRVWVEFAGSLYVVHSQSTGASSSVVITAGATLDIAVELKLGLSNSGLEVVGVDDQDFLLYTTGGPQATQPIESNTHRSGRFHSGIIKKKKMAEFTFQTFVNMKGSAGASLDNAVRLLWTNLLGKEVLPGSSIKYVQDLPNFTMSLVRVSTVFAEYYTGAYVKEKTLTFAGAGPATSEWKGKASKAVKAGLMQVDGAVSASTTVTLDVGQRLRSDAGAPVMVVDPDGRTILAGADGSLTIASIDTSLEQIVLSSAVTVGDNGFVVPWYPGAVQQTGRDAIFTDLAGSFKLKSAGSTIDITNAVLSFKNDTNDLDGYFGRDANAGAVYGNRMTMGLAVTFDLTSQETMAELVQTANFAGFDPVIVLGDESNGRYLKVTAPKWIPSVPAIVVPENGPTPVTLDGTLYQSTPGAKDPIVVEFF